MVLNLRVEQLEVVDSENDRLGYFNEDGNFVVARIGEGDANEFLTPQEMRQLLKLIPRVKRMRR